MADDAHVKRPSPHDRLVKRILTDPEAAAVELRHVLPAAIAERLDFDDVYVEPNELVDKTLDNGHTDILYSIALRGSRKRVLVYVLLEHQSKPDPMMPWRVLEEIVYIWQRYLSFHRPASGTLPFIVPVVLAQCEHGWTAPYRLSELFDLPDELREELGRPVELELLVDELDEAIAEDLRARDEIRALVELMRTLLMAHYHGDRFTEDQLVAVSGLFRIVTRSLDKSVTRTLWFYVVSVFGPQSRFRSMLLEAVEEEAKEMFDTAQEEWFTERQAKWFERKKAALVAEGRAEGRAIAKAELILGLLERRQLSVPSELRERVLATRDEPQLQQWFERAVTACSFAEVFDDTTPGS